MNLSELKQKPIDELLEMTASAGLDNLARSRKQDIIFALLKKHAKSGEDIYVESDQSVPAVTAADHSEGHAQQCLHNIITVTLTVKNAAQPHAQLLPRDGPCLACPSRRMHTTASRMPSTGCIAVAASPPQAVIGHK